MATQSITLDELLNAIKNAKVVYEPTRLCGAASGTVTLSHPITDFDFITIEAGDDYDANPDNSLSCRLAKSIQFKRSYVDIGNDNDGQGSGANNITSASAHIQFMFMDATTFRIINMYNHGLLNVTGWKAKIEWGAKIL